MIAILVMVACFEMKSLTTCAASVEMTANNKPYKTLSECEKARDKKRFKTGHACVLVELPEVVK